MKTIIVTLMVYLLATVCAHADGKFFWREKVPPDVPYQRALLLFDGDTETLILQSKYFGISLDGHSEMGWVVPVPSVPDLASMPSDEAFRVFWHLGRVTSPHVIRVSNVLIGSVLVVPILLLVLCFVPRFCRLSWVSANRRTLRNVCVTIILCWIIAGFFGPNLMGGRGVDVIKSESVGVYDVKVIASSNPDELIEWLNDSGFRFEPSDTAVFSSYLDRGWCFTVAHIKASRSDGHNTIEGLADPLILRFLSTEGVYPLALTSTGGHDTEILLYVAGEQRMTCGNRLPLQYVGEQKKLVNHIFEDCQVTPGNFFSSVSADLSQVMKFKGTLTPDEMRKDLVFKPDPVRKDYRITDIVW